ncbi:MAG: hypothetical protein GY861_12425, partial [bacterium]|nr:hypothetical protein [bacterium]
MSAPTKLISTTANFYPLTVKGIKFYPDNPFKFDFVLDQGDEEYNLAHLKQQTQRLADYFLAGLTVPEKDLWVNLSPYEADRIITPDLAMTDMGRDMLGEDYVLKQLMSSLTYPESESGKKFWQKVYQKAYQLYGTTKIPMDTFNKVWIVPEKAVVYEEADGAFIGDRHLKVMLEADYLACRQAGFAVQKNQQTKDHRPETIDQSVGAQRDVPSDINNISSQITREIILPMVEEEVNHGKNFAHLRQIYDALILATWFKKRLRQTIDNRPKTKDQKDNTIEGFYDQAYLNQNKIAGIETDDPNIKEKIYNQYVEAYKKGIYNYIRRDYDPNLGENINRRYYS